MGETHHQRWRKAGITFSLTILLAACGGGGGGSSSTTGGDTGGGDTAVTGLTMPSTMSVVQASSSASTSQASLGISTAAVADTSSFAPDSDYAQEKTNAYVFDPSMESLQTVNMILCLMDQTKAEEMVNAGAYYALVDEDKCEQGQNQSSSGKSGGSSTAAAKHYKRWTVESTRADNSSPMKVRIWDPANASGSNPDPSDLQNIMVELTATEGVSADKPFGAFTMNFEGIVDEGLLAGGSPSGTYRSIMNGLLETVENADGKPQFRFVNTSNLDLSSVGGNSQNWLERANVVLDDGSGTSGQAMTYLLRQFDENADGDFLDQYESDERSFALAFDADSFKRGQNDGTTTTEACRARNDVNTYVWRYNLYHAMDGTYAGKNVSAGDAVTMNSGFPFRYDNGASVADGYVGYWGVWLDGDGSVPDGATIQRTSFGNGNTAGTYTVHVSPGKASRRDRVTKPLADFAGETFEAWGVQHPSLGYPDENGYESWQLTLDGSGAFTITGGIVWGDDGPTVTPLSSGDQVAVTPSSGERLRMWSDALGGDVIYIGGETDLTFYKRSSVMPGDTALAGAGGSVKLYCYDRCPLGGITQTDVDTATTAGSDEGLFHTALAFDAVSSGYTYTLAENNGRIVLTDDANGKVVDLLNDTTGEPLSGLDAIGHDWGISSGEMITADYVTAVQSAGNIWAASNQPQSYSWETGFDSWMQTTTVENDSTGAIEEFDQPLRFEYTLQAATDERNGDTSRDGKTFILEYGGKGELHGFPWFNASGGSDGFERWYPAVNLKDGVELVADGDGDGTDDHFVVKAVEMEQTLKDGGSACDTMALDWSLPLPAASDVQNVGFSWADRPEPADEAPAVIEGTVQ